jgi:hypothetical protein
LILPETAPRTLRAVMWEISTFRSGIMALLLLSLGGCAGDSATRPETDPELKALEHDRAEFREKKRALVDQVMRLEGAEREAFWKEYDRYEADLRRYYDQRYRLVRDYAENYDRLTEKSAEDISERALRLQKLRLDIFQKYFQRMRKATSAVVAARFLQLEQRLSLLSDLKISSEAPPIPAASDGDDGP